MYVSPKMDEKVMEKVVEQDPCTQCLIKDEQIRKLKDGLTEIKKKEKQVAPKQPQEIEEQNQLTTQQQKERRSMPNNQQNQQSQLQLQQKMQKKHHKQNESGIHIICNG